MISQRKINNNALSPNKTEPASIEGEVIFPHNFCRILNGYKILQDIGACVIRVPYYVKRLAANSNNEEEDINLSWAFFQKLKKILKYSPLINLALDITRDLGTLESADRWFSENLKFISISNSLFMKNNKNQPVLSKSHQLIIKTLMRFKIAIVLKGNRFSCREMAQYAVNFRCD